MLPRVMLLLLRYTRLAPWAMGWSVFIIVLVAMNTVGDHTHIVAEKVGWAGKLASWAEIIHLISASVSG